MGMSATSTGGRAGFPPFPDSAAGAFAFKQREPRESRSYPPDAPFKGRSGEQGEALTCSARRRLVVYAAQQRDAEVLSGETQSFCQHFLALPRYLRLAR